MKLNTRVRVWLLIHWAYTLLLLGNVLPVPAARWLAIRAVNALRRATVLAVGERKARWKGIVP